MKDSKNVKDISIWKNNPDLISYQVRLVLSIDFFLKMVFLHYYFILSNYTPKRGK